MDVRQLTPDQRQQLRAATLARAEWLEELLRRMDAAGWDARDPFYRATFDACAAAQRMVGLIGTVAPKARPVKPRRREAGKRPPAPPGERPGWMGSYGQG
jgi:hypothetical protein